MTKYEEIKEYAKKNKGLSILQVLRDMHYTLNSIVHRNEMTIYVCSSGVAVVAVGDEVVDVLTRMDWSALNASIRSSIGRER